MCMLCISVNHWQNIGGVWSSLWRMECSCKLVCSSWWERFCLCKLKKKIKMKHAFHESQTVLVIQVVLCNLHFWQNRWHLPLFNISAYHRPSCISDLAACRLCLHTFLNVLEWQTNFYICIYSTTRDQVYLSQTGCMLMIQSLFVVLCPVCIEHLHPRCFCRGLWTKGLWR